MTRLIWTPLVLMVTVAATACSNGSPSNEQTNTATEQATPAPSVVPAEPPGTGSIVVESTPPGAAILLILESDAGTGPPRPRGSTPATLADLEPGRYTVHLESPGYRFYQATVEVKPGETARVTARLARR